MKRRMFNLLWIFVAILSCQNPQFEDEGGETRLRFVPSTADMTRGTVAIGDYFSRLAVQLFDKDGNKVFAQSKTQARGDDDFGTLNVGLTVGTYTVVAVGHSSPVTPTIKSTELVQFTAKDGVKNSDTFCHYGQVTIGEDGGYHELRMNRMTAMVTFEFTDADMPTAFQQIKIEYTGGSANFNPTTSEGCTKSNQTELRSKGTQYAVFTFPYMATECTLKMALNALDANGSVLTTKTLSDVPVTRNRITRCTGELFGDGDFEIHQTTFGITVNPDWDGIIDYQF
jgi:hypothetical protein